MEKKLGLSALTALVLSSMLGAGVFSLPQNMAAVASPAALLIGWGITGAGILLLAFAMLILTRIRPELDGGIFTYAREGFGELIGFCSAWGYWLCAVIANVSYLVIVFSALSFFTDTLELRLFGDGNTWQSIVGASALLWIVHFLINGRTDGGNDGTVGRNHHRCRFDRFRLRRVLKLDHHGGRSSVPGRHS